MVYAVDGLLFQMYALYKDPEGRKVFKSAGNSTSIAAGTPEQSTNSSVASRPAVAKEEISDASNSGCSQLIATQHTFGQVDSKGGVVATNGMNQLECHTTGLMSSKPHPLSFTNTATVTSCGCGTDGAGSYLSESPNGCNVLLETIDIAAQNVP